MTRNKMEWFKAYPGDWLAGTRALTLEQRGAYSDCLLLMYQTGGSLPDDDRWMSSQLHLDVRVWRRVKKQLLAVGKLFISDGRICNTRACNEICSRASKYVANGGIPPTMCPELSQHLSENVNKNNVTPFKKGPYARSTYLVSSIQEVSSTRGYARNAYALARDGDDSTGGAA